VLTCTSFLSEREEIPEAPCRNKFAAAGYARHLYRQLQLLRPGLIIAMDRLSERYALKWAAEQANQPVVFYFTRKRDAHAERKLLLAEIRNRFGA